MILLASIVFGIFILFGLLIMIRGIVDMIRIHNFVTTTATRVDTVEERSPEWGKYFPEEYEQIKKAEKIYNELKESGQKIQEIRDKIPFDIYNGRLVIHIGSKRKSNIEDIEKEAEKVMVYEYDVKGEKHYYCFPVDADNYSKRKKVTVKYNPKNPKYVVAPKAPIREVYMGLFMVVLFSLVLAMFILD